MIIAKISVKAKELEDLWKEKHKIEQQLNQERTRSTVRINRKEMCDVETHSELRQLLSLNKYDVRFVTGRGVHSITQRRNRTPEHGLTPDRTLTYDPFSHHEPSQPILEDSKINNKIQMTQSIDLRVNALQPTAHYQFSLDDDDDVDYQNEEIEDDDTEEEKKTAPQYFDKRDTQRSLQQSQARDYDQEHGVSNNFNSVVTQSSIMASDPQKKAFKIA